MTFSNLNLSVSFRRFTAVSLMTLAPLAMTGCKFGHDDDTAKPDTATAPQKPLVTAWQDAHGLCLSGCPAGAGVDNKVIDRPIYALSNNPKTKFADWVAYVVSVETIGTTKSRTWHRDPDLPKDETLGPSDYKGIEKALRMERGHQAPLSSLTGLPNWQMADDLSNITPQSEALNNGPWKVLEGAERKLAKREQIAVHAVTGPLYERDMPKLPNSHTDHTIPSGYWKVVAVKDGDDISVVAFIMDQTLTSQNGYCKQRVTVREVEQRSHLDLFPNLAREKQEEIETKAGKLSQRLGC